MQDNRLNIAAWTVLLLLGLAFSLGRGEVPRHDEPVAEGRAGGVAPDLALYAEVIQEVRSGRGYYEVAREKIPLYGFPIASPLNWRLPTYAWVFSILPNKCWIQAVLLLLASAGMGMTFVAESRRSSALLAGATTFLMFGVVRWTFDGEAYLAHEVWAATLIVISLAAGSLAKIHPDGERDGGRAPRLRLGLVCLSVMAGILALLVRELALPYCLVAGGMAAWKRRWVEAAGWAVGIAIFVALFVWHVEQVKAQLAGSEVVASGGIAQWLRFGGLDFVLLTTRMNSLLFGAPAWLLWLYLLVALVGLSRGRDETSRVACLTALLYVLAFAMVGRPENFYWGLMAAPLLVWGVGRGVIELRTLLDHAARAPEVAAAIENGVTPRL